MIEVYKTNVKNRNASKAVIKALYQHLGYETIWFDLQDCDKVLRIEATSINNANVMEVLRKLGFQCELLLD